MNATRRPATRGDPRNRWSKAVALVAALLTAVGGALVLAAPASAGVKNVDICHGNFSEAYVTNHPSFDSIVKGTAHGTDGFHNEDIIPAFWYNDDGYVLEAPADLTGWSFYAGRNWTANGQTIWDGGTCDGTLPDPSATATWSCTPSVTVTVANYATRPTVSVAVDGISRAVAWEGPVASTGTLSGLDPYTGHAVAVTVNGTALTTIGGSPETACQTPPTPSAAAAWSCAAGVTVTLTNYSEPPTVVVTVDDVVRTLTWTGSVGTTGAFSQSVGHTASVTVAGQPVTLTGNPATVCQAPTPSASAAWTCTDGVTVTLTDYAEPPTVVVTVDDVVRTLTDGKTGPFDQTVAHTASVMVAGQAVTLTGNPATVCQTPPTPSAAAAWSCAAGVTVTLTNYSEPPTVVVTVDDVVRTLNWTGSVGTTGAFSQSVGHTASVTVAGQAVTLTGNPATVCESPPPPPPPPPPSPTPTPEVVVTPAPATVEEPEEVVIAPLPATVEEPEEVVIAPLPATIITPQAATAGGGSSEPTTPTAAWILLLTGAMGLVGAGTRLVLTR